MSYLETFRGSHDTFADTYDTNDDAYDKIVDIMIHISDRISTRLSTFHSHNFFHYSNMYKVVIVFPQINKIATTWTDTSSFMVIRPPPNLHPNPPVGLPPLSVRIKQQYTFIYNAGGGCPPPPPSSSAHKPP